MLKDNPAAIFPYMAVIAHETIITRNAAGNSYQDVALGFEGANLGVDLWAGTVNPSEVGKLCQANPFPRITKSRFMGE